MPPTPLISGVSPNLRDLRLDAFPVLCQARTPTHPVYLTGAENGPLTPLHDCRILNDMVNDSSEQLTTVFLALADPTRRVILARLTHGAAILNLHAGNLQAFTRAGTRGSDPAP